MRTSLVRFLSSTLAAALVVATGHAVPTHAASAGQTVTASLAAAAGSRVSGTATLTAVGTATRITWAVTGVAPGSSLRSTLQAGTCATPSASFRYLATLTADAGGAARATATTDLSLSLLADGNHIIEIQSAACGSIPEMGATPVSAPAVASAACAFTLPDSQALHVLPLMSGPATITRVRGSGLTFTLSRFAGFNTTIKRAFGLTPPAGDLVAPFTMALPDGHYYAGLANVVHTGGREVVCLRGIAYRDQGNGANAGLVPPSAVRLDGTISAGYARIDLRVGKAHYYVYGRPVTLP